MKQERREKRRLERANERSFIKREFHSSPPCSTAMCVWPVSQACARFGSRSRTAERRTTPIPSTPSKSTGGGGGHEISQMMSSWATASLSLVSRTRAPLLLLVNCGVCDARCQPPGGVTKPSCDDFCTIACVALVRLACYAFLRYRTQGGGLDTHTHIQRLDTDTDRRRQSEQTRREQTLRQIDGSDPELFYFVTH